ncbi:MAG: hypothetical protein ACREM3_18540 [Candidatus Rokuibacteriota bacterium]
MAINVSTTERTTPTFTTTLLDAASLPVPGTSLQSILLTLYDVASGSIINSRNLQSVLGGDVTVDALGLLIWVLKELDTVIVNDALAEEEHIALFEIRWLVAGSPRVMREDVSITVRNLARVS